MNKWTGLLDEDVRVYTVPTKVVISRTSRTSGTSGPMDALSIKKLLEVG